MKILGLDHISRTVPDLAAAVEFYRSVFDAKELFRLGPIDAGSLPKGEDGTDWMALHVGVPGACLTLAMLELVPGVKVQLVQYDKPEDRLQAAPRNCDVGGYHIALLVDDVPAAGAALKAAGCRVFEVIEMSEGPLAGKKNLYVADPWGLSFELVD